MENRTITMVVPSDETVSLSDAVGVVQESCKGVNFWALYTFITDSGLMVQEAMYMPRIQPPVGRDVVTGYFTLSPLVMPNRFEQLLQFVRTFYPGCSFQQIKLRVSGEFLIIGPA